MKNSNVSPAVAAAELLRRRREGLIDGVCAAINDRAIRLKGRGYNDLEAGTRPLVLEQVLDALTDSELTTFIAYLEEKMVSFRRGATHTDQDATRAEQANGPL